jgi:hypothetical protein
MTKKPNLIGISGRIGSGKDTVGALIQYLLHVNKEEKAGRVPNHGLKDYLALRGRATHTDWKIKKFAGKLKDVASLLTGIPAEQFEDQEFKSTALGEKWSYYEDGCSNDMTVRLFLQKLGTEAIRNGLHTNAWVNALFADYKDVKQSEDGLIHEKYGEHDITIVPNPILWSKYYPNWIITDLRFPNEFEAIKNRGGLCIQIDRKNSFHSRLVHSSEIALDSHKFDYVLNNPGSIDDLVEEVRRMLVHFKLLES